MFSLLRKLATLLVVAVLSRLVYALPRLSERQVAQTTAAAATTTQPPAAPATVYTYTTIIDGVTYTNIDTYTPTYEPTVMPTLTLQGSVMPYSEFTALYFPTATSSAQSAYLLPPGVVWMGVTTFLGFVLGVRAVGLL